MFTLIMYQVRLSTQYRCVYFLLTQVCLDSIILTSTIGKIYCDMGYTGKASIELNQAKLAISNRTCSNASELVYRIHYAYYLICIGDYETRYDKKKNSVYPE
jgi:hypothetical protein